MFRNAGLVLRSLALCFALGSVFACAAEDTGEEQGQSGSELSKGKKHPKADASTDEDGGVGVEDGGVGVQDGGCYEVDGGCYETETDGGAYEDGGEYEADGGVEDGGTAW